MKNYPNQASNFERIRNTLSTVKDLKNKGHNVADDGVLGYELARRKVYTFRGFDYVNGDASALEERIRAERAKPGSNQGARTFARELRRTLVDLGWIDAEGAITSHGDLLLDTTPDSDEERQLLADALLELELPGGPGDDATHPIVILLKLLRHSPTHHRAGFELALAFSDDDLPDTEHGRQMYDGLRNRDAEYRAKILDVSETVRANSVKVFPTLAKYAGLVIEDQLGQWSISPEGLEALGIDSDAESVAAEVTETSPTPIEPKRASKNGERRRRLTKGRFKSADHVGMHALNKVVPKGLTPDQQAEAQTRLRERTTDHQALVRYFAQTIDGGNFYEDTSSYDLAWVSDQADDIHLFEMKTISSDADAQAIRAVGQLLYYSHFNIVARFGTYPSTRTLVVDGDLHPDLGDFLDTLGIGAIRAEAGSGLVALNQLGQVMLDVLPLKPNAS